MKGLITASVCISAVVATTPALSLEPWHDYHRAKAHQQKKAQKAAANAAQPLPESARVESKKAGR